MTTSILEHLRTHLDPTGTGLLEGGETLPDEDGDESGLRWAPGAMDGVFGHHVAQGESDLEAARLVELLEDATSARWRRAAARQRLYDALRETSVVSVIDEVLDRVGDARAHHDVAQWLVREGSHREPVKFGMALLGRGAVTEDLGVLRTLARHEEFTLFAAVALANLTDDPEVELWNLAKGVDGWGRIQIIERLAGTERPEIKDWLLRGGFRNSVMNEYTAFIAATTGDLVTALERPVDDELRDAAVEIMRALIEGGPAQDIGDYAEGPLALRLVLAEVELNRSKPAHGMLVVEASRLLTDDDRLEHWTPEVRAQLAADCRRILADPAWADVVEAGLADDATFWDAEHLGHALGIDTVPGILRKLEQDPFSPSWWQAMQRVDQERLAVPLAIADEHFRAELLGTGPAEEMGFGPMYAQHSALEHLVTGLARFPGAGWRHVQTALRSPVIRSRNMALNTLAAWGTASWPPDAHDVLAEALSREPHEDVRRRIERLLAGEPLDDSAGGA